MIKAASITGLSGGRLARAGFLLASAAAILWLVGAGDASADQVRVNSALKILREGANLAVYWQLPAECDTNLTLQWASDPSGPWSVIAGAGQPFVPLENWRSNGFYRVELPLPAGSSNASQIAQSVRAFAFASNPQLNPLTRFDIRLEPIRGLWEALQIQVAEVWCGLEGQQVNPFACVIYHGAVKVLGSSFGGYGLMSGLLQGEGFYFTYSWGSGIHRSHLGKLQIVNGEVKLWDTGGFNSLDLFFSRRVNGEIVVEAGRYEGFNAWQQPVSYGRIDESDPASTKLVGADGSVLATFTPVGG